jgi:hypothetical protein
MLPRQGDIRLALAGIILGQGRMDQRGAGAGQFPHRIGQFDHCELAGITHVHRPGQVIGISPPSRATVGFVS